MALSFAITIKFGLPMFGAHECNSLPLFMLP
jgi:hypothetical protein